jgi:beta-phosphoglucomutase
MGSIKAFLFDMDGVLTETSTYHYLAWKELADSIGIEIDSFINERLKGVSRMASLDLILVHGKKEGIYSLEGKNHLAESKNKRYLEMIDDFNETNLFPGVRELMIKLKERGIKIAIASASHSAPLLVQRMGIEEFVDFIANPANIPGKPQPDIFLQGARALNLETYECVGVEDAIAGIEAIKAAEMLAIGIGSKELLSRADFIYEHTGEIDLETILHRRILK